LKNPTQRQSSHIPDPQLINSTATVNRSPLLIRRSRRLACCGAAIDRRRNDAAQCKRISIQHKRPEGMAAPRDDNTPNSLSARSAWPFEILSVRGSASGQANFAELWDCRVAAGGLINNNMSTNWSPHV
jgi:hypothetical protein